ncbi:hypothetical protein D3C79_874810 [compost metagenome]
MRPPCARAIWLAMYSPSPSPCCGTCDNGREKGWNNCARVCTAMGAPWLCTLSTNSPAWRAALTATGPCGSPWVRALAIRFESSWVTRSRSQYSPPMSPMSSTIRRCGCTCCSSEATCRRPSARSGQACRFKGMPAPRRPRAKSSTSRTSCEARRPQVRICWAIVRCWSSCRR